MFVLRLLWWFMLVVDSARGMVDVAVYRVDGRASLLLKPMHLLILQDRPQQSPRADCPPCAILPPQRTRTKSVTVMINHYKLTVYSNCAYDMEMGMREEHATN